MVNHSEEGECRTDFLKAASTASELEKKAIPCGSVAL